jgi:hypothetical protein
MDFRLAIRRVNLHYDILQWLQVKHSHSRYYAQENGVRSLLEAWHSGACETRPWSTRCFA